MALPEPPEGSRVIISSVISTPELAEESAVSIPIPGPLNWGGHSSGWS